MSHSFKAEQWAWNKTNLLIVLMFILQKQRSFPFTHISISYANRNLQENSRINSLSSSVLNNVSACFFASGLSARLLLTFAGVAA